MLIDCPGCARSYHVSSADLGRGRTLVCPRCNARWHQDAHDPAHRASSRNVAAFAVSERTVPMLDERPAPRTQIFVPRPLFAFAGATMACMALLGLVIGRERVVRAVPRAAGLYAGVGLPVNVVGLAIEKVAPQRLASNDVTIKGALRNVAGRRMHVPRLAFEVRDATGATLVTWSEAVSAASLPQGRALNFASTPHRLPPTSRTVLVHFD